MYHGNFDWGDVWDGALSGGLSAGLSSIRQLQQLAQTPIGAIAVPVVIQGTVVELTGGEFEEGAIDGLLLAISEEILSDMNSAIDQSGLTGAAELAARQTARVVSTAVQIANTDGHPGQVLAQELLGDLIQFVGADAIDAFSQWGFNVGVSISDWLNPPATSLTTNDIIVNVTEILASDSAGTGEQITFTEGGINYRLQVLPNGLVQLFVEGQSEPVLELPVVDEAVSYTHLTLPTIYAV